MGRPRSHHSGYEGGQYYLKSEEEMRKLFSYAPQALDNTHKIAEKCYFDMPKHKRVIPHFDKHKEFKQIFLKKVF